MGVAFHASAEAGRNLFGTIQKVTSTGGLGDHWNASLGTFEANPSIADRTISLTEDDPDSPGSYNGGTPSLSTFTGRIKKRVHDADLSNLVVGEETSFVQSGDEPAPANSGDILGLPASVRAELQSNPVDSANMRGTDNALLASTYVAPDNTGIANAETSSATAATQATTAATQSTAAATDAATLESRLTAVRATNLDSLDAAITTRSSHSAADVRAELNTNPVDAANMRGTDNALLAASYVAADNTGISNAETAALAAQAASESVDTKLTTTRAGYLDNLSAGAVAQETSVQAITNSVRNKVVVTPEAQIPASGSETFNIEIVLYDNNGEMEDADANPTITAANQSGTDRSVNLSSVTRISKGVYTCSYTVASTHAQERIVFTVNYTENAKPLVSKAVMSVVAVSSSGSGFTSSDRTKLDGVFNKLPSKSYLTGTTAADGDIDVSSLDGDLTLLHADVSTLATAASITSLPSDVQSELTTNPVPSSNMRGTDAALLAASYVAPDNTGIANAETDASTAASQATTAATQATAAAGDAATLEARLTLARATNLDNLDVLVSSRSDFDESTDNVTLATGHGLAEATELAAVKAKTDLIPAAPAAVGDVPTASQVATQVDSTLTTSHGSGQWDAASDATLANQQSIINTLGGFAATPPSTIVVSNARTWRVQRGTEDDRAPQVVTLSAGSAVTLAMDFTSALNDDTGISTVVSATDISGEGGTLTIDNLLPSQDRNKAHFDVSALEAGKRYEIKVTVSTSDQQTLTGKGILRVD